MTPQQIDDAVKQAIPMNRQGIADDVAPSVAFLFSDDASYITGTSLVIDGGFVARSPAGYRGIVWSSRGRAAQPVGIPVRMSAIAPLLETCNCPECLLEVASGQRGKGAGIDVIVGSLAVS